MGSSGVAAVWMWELMGGWVLSISVMGKLRLDIVVFGEQMSLGGGGGNCGGGVGC